MGTLSRIARDAQEAAAKAARFEKLTRNEVIALEIYNRLTGKNSSRAGKRKQERTGK